MDIPVSSTETGRIMLEIDRYCKHRHHEIIERLIVSCYHQSIRYGF